MNWLTHHAAATRRLLVIVSMLIVASWTPANPTTQPSPAIKIETTMALTDFDATFTVVIVDRKAMLFEETPDTPLNAIFDLDKKSFHDMDRNESLTLEQAEEWAERWRKQVLESLESIPDEKQRALMRAAFEPKFQSSENDGEITLQGELVSFVITPDSQIDNSCLDLLLEYDELNAYYQSASSMEAPPFVHLALIKEYKARRIWPAVLVMKISTPDRNTEVRTTLVVSALTESEIADARERLAEIAEKSSEETIPAQQQ